MSITEILTTILIISASALCVALINFYYQMSKSVRSIIVDVQELFSEIKPLLKIYHKIFKKINDMSSAIESKLQISGSIILKLKDLLIKY